MDNLELRMAGFHTVECGISCLARARVFAGCLAQIFRRRGHVQQIVRDLKQESKVARVFGGGLKVVLTCAGDDRAAARSGTN